MARQRLLFEHRLHLGAEPVMIALWAYRLLNDWTTGAQTLKTPLEEQTVNFLVFIDVVIVLYMAFYDGVTQAFEKARF